MRAADIIVAAVAVAFRVPSPALTGKSRFRHVVEPRFAACLLLRELKAPDGRTRSYPEIGRVLGGRDHSTMIYACGRAAELMARSPEYADSLAEARALATGQMEWPKAMPKAAPPPPKPITIKIPSPVKKLDFDERSDMREWEHRERMCSGSRRLADAIERARAA